MDWPTRPLKELCRIEKGAIGITKAKPGPYPLVTLAEERKEHNDYQFDTKAVIIPLVSSTGHGHASIKRIHYQEGKFTVGTILCAVVPNNESELHPLFLYHYLDVFKEQLLVPLMRGMANVTLPMRSLGDLEIPVPPIDDQLVWIEKFKSVNHKETKLLNELSHQQTLLKQLRQAILQEAVQGKLTEQWRSAHPEVEPASALLERIQAEKAQLVKEKKIKKSRPLSPITPDEIPFDLPEGWVWCRLGAAAFNVEYGTSQKASLDSKGVPVLRMGNLLNGNIVYDNLKYVQSTIKDLPRLYLNKGDLLFNRTNSYELVGKSGVFTLDKSLTFASYLIRVTFEGKIVSEYVNAWINSLVCRETQLEPGIIQQNGQANFNGTKLKNILLPLPSLSEQKAIVEKVESLLAKVSQLEAEVQQNRQYAEQLLQSVLREVMNPAAKETTA